MGGTNETPARLTPPRGGPFGAILADPPWRFETYSPKGKGRSPEAWYDCLSTTEIMRIPVAKWAKDDAVLFLWATDPLLPRAFEVIEAWGFVYKTIAFTWVKTNRDGTFFTGLGYWTRANPEICLLATRGNPKRIARDVPRLVVAPRREHSRKPDQVYDRIERLVGGPYLEVFARRRRPGWTAWGAEVGLLDAGGPRRRWRSARAPMVSSRP